MVEVAQRPQMIESPRITADSVVWESYDELVQFLARHAEPGAEPEVFQNERGEWVRWWLQDDPEHTRVNPANGLVESRQVYVQRRVALSQAETLKPGVDMDFVLPAEPGSLIYGQPYVWMHSGRKPEADPGFWYAQQEQERKQKVGAIREAWKPLPASAAADFIAEQKRLRDNASMADVIQAAIEVQAADTPARRGPGRPPKVSE